VVPIAFNYVRFVIRHIGTVRVPPLRGFEYISRV
jgi:hypothetical protein